MTHFNLRKTPIDICNKYGVTILFSTKSDELYDCNIRPDLHTFQLSVTNVDDRKDIEPNVPPIRKRFELFKTLKKDGFKVGIRIQPFIPGITDIRILEMFHDADQFTIEGLKLVPQNREHKEMMLQLTGISRDSFTQMGLLNLKPEIRLSAYEDFISYLEANNMPYSIADNDLHHMGNNKCCCGDKLIPKSTSFNNTAMVKKYGVGYTKDDIYHEIGCVCECKCNQLFTSNRQEGCTTVGDFYNKRFSRSSSPFSPKFLYGINDTTMPNFSTATVLNSNTQR